MLMGQVRNGNWSQRKLRNQDEMFVAIDQQPAAYQTNPGIADA
jgi:hypothetical protein